MRTDEYHNHNHERIGVDLGGFGVDHGGFGVGLGGFGV
jgi:hypothetical protein